MNMEKEKREFHNKDLYLLGIDENNTRYYLESPSWDCDWYWGFGYIQGFNGKTISDRSHESHQHANNFMSEWFTEWNGSKPKLKQQTFTEKEGWELSELFNQFYHWKEHAEVIGKGGCHVVTIEDLKWYKNAKPLYNSEVKHINEEIIPEITARIIKILTP